MNDYHMFGYEKVAGQAFIKSTEKRLTTYEWTETSIKFSIPDIDRNVDLGVYEGEAATKQAHMKTSIEIKHISGMLCIFLYLNTYFFQNVISFGLVVYIKNTMS